MNDTVNTEKDQEIVDITRDKPFTIIENYIIEDSTLKKGL